MIEKMLVVALGGSLGAVLRFWVGTLALQRLGNSFPWGTLAVNLAGCFGLALFATVITTRLAIPDHWRLLVATGFFGSLTTFSTFSLEAFELMANGHGSSGVLYLGLSVGLGLLAVVGGIGLGHLL